MDDGQRRRTTYREVFATRGYPALFAASTLAVLATSVQILAFSVLVYAATASPALSAAAFAAGFLPGVLGGAVLPSLADRIPARRLVAAGGLVRAGCAALLAREGLGIGAGFAVVAAGAALQPLFSSAQSGLVSRLLDEDRYVLGRSLFTITSMVAQLSGLALGGGVLGVLGVRGALGLAAAVQVLAALVAAVGLPATPVVGRRDRRWRPGESWRGYRELLGVPLARSLLWLWWVPVSLAVGAESLAVAYAGDAGAGGPATGALMASPPLGALLGQVAVGRLCTPRTRERLVPVLLGLLGVALLPLCLDPPPWVAAGLLVVANCGLAFELGGQAEFRAALPRGREALGFGLLGVGLTSGQGVGPLLAGPVAEVAGPGTAMAALGVAVLLAAAALLPPVRRARARAAP